LFCFVLFCFVCFVLFYLFCFVLFCSTHNNSSLEKLRSRYTNS
jgi:hypothetical protein